MDLKKIDKQAFKNTIQISQFSNTINYITENSKKFYLLIQYPSHTLAKSIAKQQFMTFNLQGPRHDDNYNTNQKT